MATAVLKIDGNKSKCFGMITSDPEEAFANIKQAMTFSRDAPPPQLPQIPGQVWAQVWDTLVACFVEDTVAGAAVMKILPFQFCICCCGPCYVMPKMMAVNMKQAQRWSDMLAEVQPMLATYNIGVSIEVQLTQTAGGTEHGTQTSYANVGLRFDGAGAMPGQDYMEKQPRTRGLSSQPTAMVPSKEPSEKTGQWRHFSTPFGEYDVLKPFAHMAEEASDNSSEESEF